METTIQLPKGFSPEQFLEQLNEALAKLEEVIKPLIDKIIEVWQELSLAFFKCLAKIPLFKKYAWAILIEHHRAQRAQLAIPRKRTIKPRIGRIVTNPHLFKTKTAAPGHSP